MFFRKILFVVLSILLTGTIYAQKNAIKTSISGMFLGDLGLSYERHLENGNSLHFKMAFLKPTISPFIDEKMLTPDAYTLKDYDGGFNLAFEYRFYLHKELKLNGLYIAPYLRYYNQKGLYLDEIDGVDYNVDAKLNTLGAGAQIGYQWIISERVALDFSFFGAGLDWMNLNSKYVAINPPDDHDYNTIIDDISEVFEDVKYFDNKLTHRAYNDKLTSKLPFAFPGFRMSLSLGIAF